MGILRVSKRNNGDVFDDYESELRLVFAEAVTLLRFAFFRVVLPRRFLLRGCGSITNHHKVNRPGGTNPVSVLFS